MGRLFVNILLVACFALPSWGRHISEIAGLHSKVDGHEYKLMLCCDVSADTTYSITLWDDGHVYRSEDAMLLLKLGDDTVIELNPSDRSCIQEIDSMYYNNEGKAVFIHRNEMLYDYPVDKADLLHIIESGIVKVRIGLYKLFGQREHGSVTSGARNLPRRMPRFRNNSLPATFLPRNPPSATAFDICSTTQKCKILLKFCD